MASDEEEEQVPPQEEAPRDRAAAELETLTKNDDVINPRTAALLATSHSANTASAAAKRSAIKRRLAQLRDTKLSTVSVSDGDCSLVANCMEISELAAKRALQECDGDVEKALRKLIAM